MLPELPETIAALDDGQVIICCRALVLLLDRRLAADPASHRPKDFYVSDFSQWVERGGDGTRALVTKLSQGRLADAALIGRGLMFACRRAGFANEVRNACRLVMMPVDHLGNLSPGIVVAALATVLSWHPGCPDLAPLLQPSRRQSTRPPEGRRRYPWFQAPPRPIEQRLPEKEK